MLLSEFLKDEGRLAELKRAAVILDNIGAFGILLELATVRNAPTSSSMEHAALRASWYDGYASALKDLFQFHERYISITDEKRQEVLKVGFSAAEELLRTGVINKEEYDRLKSGDTE